MLKATKQPLSTTFQQQVFHVRVTHHMTIIIHYESSQYFIIGVYTIRQRDETFFGARLFIILLYIKLQSFPEAAELEMDVDVPSLETGKSPKRAIIARASYQLYSF